jgi:hypothetical protein
MAATELPVRHDHITIGRKGHKWGAERSVCHQRKDNSTTILVSMGHENISSSSFLRSMAF